MALVLKQPKRVYSRTPRRLPLIDQHPPYKLLLNGVDGCIIVPNSPSLNPTSAITLQAWVYKLANQGWMRIFEKDAYFAGQTGFSLIDVNGTVRWELWNPHRYFDTSNAIPLNVLLNIAATYDGSLMKLYINGQLVNSYSTSGGINAGNNGVLGIGTAVTDTGPTTNTSEHFPGFVICPLMYGRALSQAEIQYNMYNPLNPIRDGLVLFLPFIEGSGTTVRDYSGLGNNGTLYGGVSWVELAKYEIPAGAML
jgi:hypothetical protein